MSDRSLLIISVTENFLNFGDIRLTGLVQHARTMKAHQVCYPKFPVKQIANRILSLRQITWIDQQLFMSAALSKATLSQEEESLVEQIYQDLNRGLIRVI
jgi:hypothetical protein